MLKEQKLAEMPRIYYKSEQLAGQVLDQKILSSSEFDEIFTQAEHRLYEFSSPESGFFKRLFGKDNACFRYVQLSKDGIPYTTREGSFFLPVSLIFYDVDDASFPTLFYFIAKLGDQLELRQCQAGQGVQWFQIPDLHDEVTDPKIIHKIKNSLSALKEKTAIEFAGRPLHEQSELGADSEECSEEYPELDEHLKQAYAQLAEICLKQHPRKSVALDYIHQMQNTDDDFFSSFGQLIDDLWQENIRLFVSMDWKQEVTDLEWHLQSMLKDNWQLELTLPDLALLGDDAVVSEDGVFEQYYQVLLKQGLKLGFVDMDSDSYVFMLHPADETETVKKAVETIGYRYL